MDDLTILGLSCSFRMADAPGKRRMTIPLVTPELQNGGYFRIVHDHPLHKPGYAVAEP